MSHRNLCGWRHSGTIVHSSAVPDQFHPRVALCVCTRSRPEMLKRCLQAISKLTPPAGTDLSIIVIDNEPEPNNRAIVEGFPATVYVHEPRPGIAFARNAAIEAALALEPHWIAFVDDDAAPQPDWLLSILRAQAEHGADVIESRVVPIYPEPKPFWAYKNTPRPGEVPLCEDWGLKSSAGTNGTMFSTRLVSPSGLGLRFNSELGRGDDLRIWDSQELANQIQR